MPNVLILGGSGLLGAALTQSLLRSGNYVVYVQTRDTTKAQALAAAEAIPLVFSLEDETALKAAISNNDIHTVVHVSQGYQAATTILQAVISASKDRRTALAKEAAVGPKLSFVYTSGTMVHGSPTKRVSDLAPQAILAAREFISPAVIRPGLLYGRNSWSFGAWWAPIAALQKSGRDELIIHADTTARAPLIHVEDAAAGFHAVIDRLDGRLGDWPVFDLVTETVSLREIVQGTLETLKVSAKVGYNGPGDDLFAQGLGLRANVDSTRAQAVLDWQPRRREFLLNLPLYFAAWQAVQE